MQKLIDTNKKILDTNSIIDEVVNSSSNDWNELCERCSSLVSEANLTSEDIDNIVAEAKRELN